MCITLETRLFKLSKKEENNQILYQLELVFDPSHCRFTTSIFALYFLLNIYFLPRNWLWKSIIRYVTGYLSHDWKEKEFILGGAVESFRNLWRKIRSLETTARVAFSFLRTTSIRCDRCWPTTVYAKTHAFRRRRCVYSNEDVRRVTGETRAFDFHESLSSYIHHSFCIVIEFFHLIPLFQFRN